MEENNLEFEQEVERKYNEWLEINENRNISYGEMFYIQNLSEQDLKDMYEELLEQLKED